jgi:hypothetical protein
MRPTLRLVPAHGIHLLVAFAAQMGGDHIVTLNSHSTAIDVPAHAEVVGENRGSIVRPAADAALILRRVAQLLDETAHMFP